MRTRLKFFLLSLTTLISLASCGGMETIVSVYPDGTAELAYTIEAPVGKMPDLAAMGKGDLAEIFKKDQYLSQEPQVLIDSLINFGVQPLLEKLRSSGQIRNFSITDSTEFTQKKVRVAIDLGSYSQVGAVHSSFKREIPALDSIMRKLTKRPANAKPDSIAIVNLGDSLEMQLHHFIVQPELVTMTREERVANGRRMMDSIFNLIVDPNSIFGYMMGEEERAKMLDSMNTLKATASDDMFDSIGRAYQLMGDMSGELFKPKISLRAPLMLSSNEDELSGRFSATIKNGMMQFEPSTPYGDVLPTSTPVRQRFKLTLPRKRSTTEEERAEWRSILRWCEECESAFLDHPAKTVKENVIFHPAVNGSQLIEVDCGSFRGEKAKAFFTMMDMDGMPVVAVHQFPLAFYVDDPVSEMRTGNPRFVTSKTDIVIGKIAYDPKAQTFSIDRPTAKEVFDMSSGTPQFKSGSYKDKAGKWIKQEGYVSNSSELFEGSRCAEGVMLSSELPQQPTSSMIWESEGSVGEQIIR